MSDNENSTIKLPLLPLRDVVVYPHMVIPLFVGREKSIQALEAAMANDKRIALVAQKEASNDSPGFDDIYEYGTLATILQLMKLPDGTVKVLVEGNDRCALQSPDDAKGYTEVFVDLQAEENSDEPDTKALSKLLLTQFEKYVNLGKKVPAEVLSSVNDIDDASRQVDTIAAHLSLPIDKKQLVLETVDVYKRTDYLISLLEAEIDLFQVENRIRGRVKKQMEKSQREYYLNEQMKAIQKELGDMDDMPNEVDQLKAKITEAKMPKPAEEKAFSELNKLKMMSPMSAEASVIRTYLDWMVTIPWKQKSKIRHDLAYAEKVLNKDHYGLEEVKERVLEYLAVQKRVKKLKGSVLCLVGPPGVGKTSLGESIAKAVNRKFVRMSLGGVRDEAEIRGHRRTYIGAMPGKIIQKMAKTGVKNPLILLDEIDKMGMDHRGDPASALLEVLDPEQNHNFNDHYLEADYDLSEVLFICTSNSMNMPGPLLDRMEIVRIPGYTEDEKQHIAEKYLLPKQVKNNGLKPNEFSLPPESIQDIIRYYTREAGVRGLEREISKVSRKVVKEIMLDSSISQVNVKPETLEDYLGVRKFDFGRAEDKNEVGLVTGLAWTQVGGELLNIEAVVTPGKGMHVRTGSLGDVMQESIQTAMTVVKSRAQDFGVPANFLQRHDLHIHMPEGATPKDGPSAGIGMCTAMVSVLTGIAVKSNVAMTGEVTLRGQVLKIGGLKEKLLAAHRGGIDTIIIPKENERDLKEIPEKVTKALSIFPVSNISEVLEIALESKPKPISDEEYLAGMDVPSSQPIEQMPGSRAH
ncbi:MAG: endopeptidase La [Cellvibrionales bacterium]|nr:endopeptidase La [Cellvibrionales bacterium]